MSEQQNTEQPMNQPPTGQTTKERTWTEEIEMAGGELVNRIKELIAEGNVRRVIIRNPNNDVILEIPLTAGAVVAGALTFFTPVIAALGVLGALLAKVKVEVVRVEGK